MQRVDVVPEARQAMGFNVFTLFVESGIGSVAFGAMLSRGFSFALIVFAIAQAVAASWSIGVLQAETSVGMP